MAREAKEPIEENIPFLSQSSSFDGVPIRTGLKNGAMKKFALLQVCLLLIYSVVSYAIIRVFTKDRIKGKHEKSEHKLQVFNNPFQHPR